MGQKDNKNSIDKSTGNNQNLAESSKITKSQPVNAVKNTPPQAKPQQKGNLFQGKLIK